MERWPNFFIVGAPKAGTTSLYEYLKDVPGIYMSPVKEPNFFSYVTRPKNPKARAIQSREKYLKLFDGAKEEKILGEASTSYLSVQVAHKIHEINPQAHILISLRDPIERLFSGYLMHYRLGNFRLSFHDQLEETINSKEEENWELRWFDRGFYFKDVKGYLDIFGPKQVKIIIFEDWIKNIEQTIQEIIFFLGLHIPKIYVNPMVHNEYEMFRGKISKYILRSKTIDTFVKAVMTKSQRDLVRKKLSKKDKKPEMTEQDRKLLIDYYKDDVRKLENLLGRKLPWKNFVTN